MERNNLSDVSTAYKLQLVQICSHFFWTAKGKFYTLFKTWTNYVWLWVMLSENSMNAIQDRDHFRQHKNFLVSSARDLFWINLDQKKIKDFQQSNFWSNLDRT